jgi:glutathione S-transferase
MRAMPTAGLYRFYAAEVSYFSAKVRPALRYKRVPFVEILATPDAYRRVIRPRTGLAMIPVVTTPEDDIIQDSSDILDALETRFPDPPLFPRTPVQRMAAYLIELYADEFLMLPGLHYRWSFPESETKARADFAASNGNAAMANRFADAIKGFVPMVGVLPHTIPAIEAHTHALLERLDAHLADHAFVLGARPSLADCALMGPLYPHLYLDAVPGRLLRELAPRVCHWIERMNHPDPDASADWLAADALAPTLRPLLELAAQDGLPMILDTARAFDDWVDANAVAPGEVPRGVGMHACTLRGVAFDRITTPYTMWMVQRVRDAYRRLSSAERVSVDRALGGLGFEALLAYEPRHRVVRRPFKVELER